MGRSVLTGAGHRATGDEKQTEFIDRRGALAVDKGAVRGGGDRVTVLGLVDWVESGT